jgi:hypothetical protein
LPEEITVSPLETTHDTIACSSSDDKGESRETEREERERERERERENKESANECPSSVLPNLSRERSSGLVRLCKIMATDNSTTTMSTIFDEQQMQAAAAMLRQLSDNMFADGRWVTGELRVNEFGQLLRLVVAPLQELTSTLRAYFSNKSWSNMMDDFLAAPRNLSGIASDAEAAAVTAFRSHLLIVLSTCEQVEVRHAVTETFHIVVVRVGDALVRYLGVGGTKDYHKDDRTETLTMRSAASFGAVAVGTTIRFDRMFAVGERDDEGWLSIKSNADLRNMIGSAADGLSDDTLVQITYGALSGQVSEVDVYLIKESILADAFEFTTGEYTEDGDQDEEQEEGDEHEEEGDDDGDGDAQATGEVGEDGDDNDDHTSQSPKRLKIDTTKEP